MEANRAGVVIFGAMNAVPLPYEGKSSVGIGCASFRDTHAIALGLSHNVILDDKGKYSMTFTLNGGMAKEEFGVSGGLGFNF